MALPADPGSLQGWDPSLAIVDELHVVTDDTFEAMAARAGKREQSLLLAISTPPKTGQDDSVMRRLVDHGRDGGDPSFYFREFAAPPGCAVDDEAAWAVANPALDDFLHRDALRATLPPKMGEAAFRRYRLGQWVTHDDAWLPDGAWAACTDATRSIPNGADVVISLDGSFSRDCTALAVATVDQRPHVELYRIWEAPEGRRDWRVPIVSPWRTPSGPPAPAGGCSRSRRTPTGGNAPSRSWTATASSSMSSSKPPPAWGRQPPGYTSSWSTRS
jgi:phage terminase large subunit-like protein